MALQKVKKVKGEKVITSARIGFDQWSTEARAEFTDKLGRMLQKAIEKLVEKTVDEMITECLDIATREYECDAFLDKQSVDTVKVELPLGESDAEGPQWGFSLTELINGEIELFEEGYRGPIGDPKDRARLRALSDHLGTLLDQIDQALGRVRKRDGYEKAKQSNHE